MNALAETFRLFPRFREVKALMREETISAPFRERIMMAVTQVNGCRYCSYYHSKQSLEAGISNEELRCLLDSNFENCPDHEIAALHYAQHWAEMDAHPDESTREAFLSHYSNDESRAIELAMQLIRIGNLWGNSWDYILFRLTGGRKGLLRSER